MITDLNGTVSLDFSLDFDRGVELDGSCSVQFKARLIMIASLPFKFSKTISGYNF